MTITDQRIIRFMDRVRAKPDFVPPLPALRQLGLSMDDVAAMRAGTWTPPPTPLEAAVDAAVRAHLAPVKEAIEQARGALQALADAPPHPTDVPAAVQAVAAATVAIGDALPEQITATPVNGDTPLTRTTPPAAAEHAQGRPQ